ncbi:MAG: Rho termination factor N-terminal domain-containing protein, partial [Candidatus Lokiarchaeota archaeon]|nr:Rho termination factor N-terminal domain-containing protein [Candidatus Lokiarchaeota archaeon]
MKRQLDDKTYMKHLLQFLNVDGLKQICRDYDIKGFSRLKKSELIEFILDSLAEEELEDLIKQKELEIISEGINLA